MKADSAASACGFLRAAVAPGRGPTLTITRLGAYTFTAAHDLAASLQSFLLAYEGLLRGDLTRRQEALCAAHLLAAQCLTASSWAAVLPFGSRVRIRSLLRRGRRLPLELRPYRRRVGVSFSAGPQGLSVRYGAGQVVVGEPEYWEAV